MAPNQHERYTKAMTTWGSGHGLFHPPSDINDQAKPGVCGYIDDSGIWQAIIDLTDESALNAAGLSKPGFALLKPPSTEIWGPRYTDTVKGDTISGEAALAAGIPAEFSTALSYSAQSDFAAVLLCSDPVRLAMYPHKAPFRKWAKDNAKKLLQMCGDVATHGFYVMTSTWSAQDVWINAWTNKDNSVTIGVKGSVPQVGAVGGSVQYHRGGSAGGWHQPETVVSFLPRFSLISGWR